MRFLVPRLRSADAHQNAVSVMGAAFFVPGNNRLKVGIGFRAAQKRRQTLQPAPSYSEWKQTLLDLGFLEFDVLAYDRVVLRERQLVGLGAAVLGGDVESTRVGRRQQLDLDFCSFRHGRPAFIKKQSRGRP